ncbi:LOW QUALITY PROTEIN: olfactory receptor 13C2-like [Phascolarctos cinereus]|uniref:Olfactory receptor n=1 Tax=Phascolarctos cinereus TaxID=38626 RepID=A0A6P5L6K1_PHACI|nr:LOW QUALITY PROTEIN: olfactory receptor 13C2-like [Phascolarctos cinereus]
MDGANQTLVQEFFLLGLSKHHNVEIALFVLCLGIYLIILLGNSSLIMLSILDSNLHTPMYFFLSNLSFMDIFGTSSFGPFMLVNFLSVRKTISFPGCAIQMYLTLALGTTESVLLAMMAYDRYVAICNPLRYTIIMNMRVCVQLAALSWIVGSVNSLLQTVLALRVSFCGNNIIDHFFCEILAVLKLACVDISLNPFVMMVALALVTLTPVLLILISYIFILATILRLNSAEGRKKAFSTCSAHLTVVIIFFGTILFMYSKPKAKDPDSDKLIALFYGAVTSMLNPIIYSLRNKEVKAAVKKVMFSNRT